MVFGRELGDAACYSDSAAQHFSGIMLVSTHKQNTLTIGFFNYIIYTQISKLQMIA